MDGTGNWEPLLQTPDYEYLPQISPDGQWMAYAQGAERAGGAPEVYVQRFPDLGDRQPVAGGFSVMPTWSRDGSELTFLVPSPTRLMRVTFQEDDTALGGVTIGPPEEVLPYPYFRRAGEHRPYDRAPDDERFLVISSGNDASNGASGPAPGEIHVVLNWFEELKRLVPTD
jgi:hypothetical protein